MAAVDVVSAAPAPLFSLAEVDMLRAHLPFLLQLLLDQKQKTVHQLAAMGLVLPTRTFFENEERRYTDIFSSLSSYASTRLAAPRELLQNSSDAGTAGLDISTLDLDSEEEYPELWLLGLRLESHMLFVRVADSGRWCPEDEPEGTYAKCVRFFLSLNGSSKGHAASAQDAGPRPDGGFGVGRLIILFCAPVWLFTVRHMLVIGHFNQFQLLCRRCFAPLTGALCARCFLRERDTPLGTTFLIHYKHFELSQDLAIYIHALHFAYFKFCAVPFPVTLNHEPVVPFARKHTIYRGRWFTVSTVELGAEQSEVLPYYPHVGDAFTVGLYLVRTSNGVLMFVRTIYAETSEKGLFLVDLAPSITFQDFDQSRQSLQNEVGVEFSTYLSLRSNEHSSNDIDHDFEQHVEGVEPLLVTVAAASSARLVKSRRVVRQLPHVEPDPDLLRERHVLRPGLVTCILKFTGGCTWSDLPPVWQPGQSWQQIYLLVLWTETLRLLVPAPFADRFNVGLMFSTNNEALAQRRKNGLYVFYLDPQHLQTSVLEWENYPVDDPAEKLRLTFDPGHREKLIAAVLSNATHEVAHLSHMSHNAAFISVMNTVFTKTLVDRVFDQLLDQDETFRIAAKRLFVNQAEHVVRGQYEPVAAAASSSQRKRRPVADPYATSQEQRL